MNAKKISEVLEEKLFSDGYNGYDPYDALNSPMLNIGLKWPEIAFTQFFRRSPYNLRKLFLVRKGVNPKALGLMLTAYSNLTKLQYEQSTVEKINNIIVHLDGVAYKEKDYAGWGYNFPWRNRNFKLPRYSPTSVNTAFIIHGLLDVLAIPGVSKDMIKALISCALKCFDEHFNVMEDGKGGDCISYSKFDHSRVHNANLLVAGARYRAKVQGFYVPSEKIVRQLDFSLRRVEASGRIEYGVQAEQNWADSFHTGFVLEQLMHLEPLLTDKQKLQRNSIEQYYIENYFGSNGEPYYYENKGVYDIHSPAQAIRYFSLAQHQSLSKKLLNWTVENMQAASGKFYFRKNKYYANKIDYTRWSQAWMLYAISTYATAFET